MKFKLDENLRGDLAELFARNGHDSDTVAQEHLSGADDENVYEACKNNGRTLVTLDLDFANPIRFPPKDLPGIIVLRPSRQTLPRIRALVQELLIVLRKESPSGQLWIIEAARVRIYRPTTNGLP